MKTPLSVTIGTDQQNNDVILDIGKSSHILINGTSGASHYELLHNVINTLSSEMSPSQLRFAIVDSKKVEMDIYKQLPHLLTPIINDAKKLILSLKWAHKEMERRLGILKQRGVSNIEEYQKSGTKEEEMSYIVFIVEEFADFMNDFPKELESVIVKLASTCHRVGIYLILSTNRSTRKVFTEDIQTVIPSRISFKTLSSKSSENILGIVGAERLDLPDEILIQTRDMKYPIFAMLKCLTKKEIDNSIIKIRARYQDSNISNSNDYSIDIADEDDNDDLYEDVKETVIETGRVSTSFIQRKFGVGYSRAAHLVDMLESRGVIGPSNGSSPREVIVRSNIH